MGGQGVNESAVMLKKWCNYLPALKQTDHYLSTFGNPDKKDVTMFPILMVTKPFATAKGKGVVESWQAAVDEMNAQVNKSTCCNLCDPPIAVRTVCWRFGAVTFHSGCDDKESPNSLQITTR
jgi:hypothetical protein